jgi:hypothetical protein
LFVQSTNWTIFWLTLKFNIGGMGPHGDKANAPQKHGVIKMASGNELMTSKSYLVMAAVLVADATITPTPTATVGVDAVLSPVARLPPWKQSCWRPGMGRNIGISELSCDAVGR